MLYHLKLFWSCYFKVKRQKTKHNLSFKCNWFINHYDTHTSKPTQMQGKNSCSPLSLPRTHTHTLLDLLAAFRSDNNISQATSLVAMKAPIKSAWCCKSLVWFGACKPLKSHWAARAKCAVRVRGGGRGYMVGLALYLMHHLPLRCWFNPITRPQFFLILTQTDKVRGSRGRRLPRPPRRRNEKKKKTVASIDSNVVPPVGTSSLSCWFLKCWTSPYSTETHTVNMNRELPHSQVI